LDGHTGKAGMASMVGALRSQLQLVTSYSSICMPS
jgi:hypothetical protein